MPRRTTQLELCHLVSKVPGRRRTGVFLRSFRAAGGSGGRTRTHRRPDLAAYPSPYSSGCAPSGSQPLPLRISGSAIAGLMVRLWPQPRPTLGTGPLVRIVLAGPVPWATLQDLCHRLIPSPGRHHPARASNDTKSIFKVEAHSTGAAIIAGLDLSLLFSGANLIRAARPPGVFFLTF